MLGINEQKKNWKNSKKNEKYLYEIGTYMDIFKHEILEVNAKNFTVKTRDLSQSHKPVDWHKISYLFTYKKACEYTKGGMF